MKKAPLRGYWSEVAPEAWRSHRQSLGHTLSYVTPATLKNAEHLPYAMAAGVGSPPSAAAVTVTYPVGRFTAAPRVFGTINSGSIVSVLRVTSRTVSSFSGSSWSLSGAIHDASFDWLAVQMTPTNSGG